MKQEFRFKTNTLLKNLVGKDLINDDNIAVVELVKNSYDAKSSTVSVRFSRILDEDDAQIVISDRGIGMTLPDITDKWLNIAFSEKKQLHQENGSYYAGNKGIGRFSCDRLGAKLDVVTRAKGGHLLHLPIYWEEFELEGQKDLLIQDIPLFVSEISEKEAVDLTGSKSFPAHGTALVISQLRSEWDRDRLLDLKRSLEKFLNPNQLFQHDAFTIRLEAPDFEPTDLDKPYFEQVNGQVQNMVFEKLRFNTTYIESHVSAAEGTVSTELHHEGELVFRLVESNGGYPGLENASVVIYYLNPYKKAYFTRQTGIRSIEFGSIFLFLNGFRVAPYGDRGDDWLGLDVRKAQGTTRYLSSRDVVGRVEVSDSQNQFQPVSSREGLKNSESFKILKESYFLDVLRKLERFVVDGLDWDSVPQNLRDDLRRSEGLDWTNTAETYVESWDRKRQRIALSIMALIGSHPGRTISFWFNPALLEGIYKNRTQEVQALLAEIENSDPEKIHSDLRSGLARIRKLVADHEAAVHEARREAAELRVSAAERQQVVDKLEGEKETYRAQTLFLQSVAPTSIKDLVAFHHQISHDSTISGNYLAKALRLLKEMPNSKPVIDYIQKAALANRRVAAVAQFASKANFRSGMKREPTDIPAFIAQYVLNVAKDFAASALKVKVVNEVNEPFEIKASRVELSILIDNLISNSGKAMARHLDVQMSLTAHNLLEVRFIDDGKGLSSSVEDPEKMFEMGVTTTSGSGLGLFHARRIAESMDAKLTAVPLKPRGMELRLEFIR